jgi:tRNA (uracil-5-)-methyltransferase
MACRLCWQGVDKHASEKKLARFIIENVPDTHDIKLAKPGNKPFCFVSFPDEASMQLFETSMEGKKFKNSKVRLKPDSNTKNVRSMRLLAEVLEPRGAVVRETSEPLLPLADRVTPLHKVPYANQLEMKHASVTDAFSSWLKATHKEIKSRGLVEPPWLQGLPEIRPVIPSPSSEVYRNKLEFTIGFDENGAVCIGFNNGKMAQGNLRVERADDISFVSERVKGILSNLTQLVISSDIPVFEYKTAVGYWKTALIRVSERTSETLLMVTVKAGAPVDKIAELLRTIAGLTTVSLFEEGSKLHLVSGAGYIHERLFDKTFRVSGQSFFQVNTEGCELLYSQVKELVAGEVLLDVCCGAGTIGICCSDRVQRVIGLEIVPEAVEDAKINAEFNGVTAEYRLGRAEETLKAVLADLESANIAAVVDPPRSGLHRSLLKALRTTRGLERLVYVSCNPVSLCADLLTLCLPSHSKLHGPPFQLVFVQPVDMFPHTDHVECVVSLARVN